MRPQSLMNFALRCVRIFPGVNSRAELVTLAPGLRPERSRRWLGDYRMTASYERRRKISGDVDFVQFNFVWLLNFPVPSVCVLILIF